MLILGGGPAGYTAALYAARAGFDTLLIERMSAGGQMALTGEIENYPGFDEGVDGFTLGMKMQNAAEKFGAKTKYDEVTEVDFSGKIKKVRTVGGEFFGKSFRGRTHGDGRAGGAVRGAHRRHLQAGRSGAAQDLRGQRARSERVRRPADLCQL